MMNGWPEKYDVLGVGVSLVDYERATDVIIRAANKGLSGIVTALAVHGVVTATGDVSFREKLNMFNMVTPDGQPVRWALRILHRIRLSDRVYGPELMLRVCQRAQEMGIGVYLYGSYPHVVERLRDNLKGKISGLKIVASEPSLFRKLTQEEDNALVERINGSGARILFVGLGCPLQETFAYDHVDRIRAVQICVGAAFDFHAGNKRMAPAWMQAKGLEWLYRLGQEPTRLWRRYLSTNIIFVTRLALQLLSYRRCK